MSAVEDAAAPAARSLPIRPLLAAAGLGLGAAVWLLVGAAAPGASLSLTAALAFAPAAAVATLAALLDEAAASRLGLVVLAGLGVTLVGALISAPEPRLLLFGLAMVATMGGIALWLARAAPRRLVAAPRHVALVAMAALVIGAWSAWLLVVSKDLEIADFMTYRRLAIAVASMIDSGRVPLALAALVGSIKEDYSWFPAFAPGLVMAATAPLSRAVYTGALIAFYAAPAVFALAVLARDLARRAGLPARVGGATATLGLGIAAVCAAYPTGLAVVARGMPDIGGLALVVVALRLADRLARLLALPAGHAARVGAMTRRVALALALALFAMFAFRRWYAFAGAGVGVVLALEVGVIALTRGRAFRWCDALVAGAVGALALLALASPVLVDWLPNLSAHDYGSAYAAYRKPWSAVAAQLGDWIGLIPAFAALAGLAILATRSRDGRLLRLTVGGALVSALLFLRIQTPYTHHLYLMAPALTALIAAPLLLLFARAPRAARGAVVALAGLTMTPLASALGPFGLTPTAGLPRAPRADLAELRRMKIWVDERARPDHRVCGLGSSYTFSGQLIGELWQLDARRSPLVPDPALHTDVMMSDVDTVEGPPAAGLKDCAVMIVGEPVQTHLIPAYQQTVVIPSREMLEGVGIGAHYRRSGEVFHLEKGVSAIVFERVAPLEDSDIAALQERWRAARAAGAQ